MMVIDDDDVLTLDHFPEICQARGHKTGYKKAFRWKENKKKIT